MKAHVLLLAIASLLTIGCGERARPPVNQEYLIPVSTNLPLSEAIRTTNAGAIAKQECCADTTGAFSKNEFVESGTEEEWQDGTDLFLQRAWPAGSPTAPYAFVFLHAFASVITNKIDLTL